MMQMNDKETHNYVNRRSVYGLMNKTCSLHSELFGFWKNKKHSKYVSLDENVPDECVDNISMMYLDEVKLDKSYWESRGYKMSKVVKEYEIYSLIKIDDNINRELKGTIKKYNNLIKSNEFYQYILTKDNHRFNDICDNIISMIKKWAETSGQKYGFIRHDGIDKAFFNRLKNNEIDIEDYIIYVFEDKFHNCVGYSVIEAKSIDNNFVYLIRKCLRYTDYELSLRNLCMYIDYITFNEVLKRNKLNEIIINWGCSSGGVAKYKKEKWNLYETKSLYFYSLKPTEQKSSKSLI